MVKYDIIIVGAGLAGLTTAALLSQEGFKVGIFEKNMVTGGCSTNFIRNSFEFDASIHWINNMELIQMVLERLKSSDRIKFKQFNPLTRIITPSYESLFTFDVEKFKHELEKEFPKEASNINKFFNEAFNFGKDINLMIKSTFKYMRANDYIKFGMKYISNSFPVIKKYSKFTAKQVVDIYFKDNRLKTIIHSLGTKPNSSIYPIFSKIAWAREGNYYYPALGGGRALSDLLTEICKENGVDIFLGKCVNKILIKDKKAYGISIENGRKEYYSKYVISNVDAMFTYNELIGSENLSDKFLEKLNNRKRYPSFCMLSLGSNYDLKSKGFNGETITYNPTDSLDELMGDDVNKNRKFIHLRSMRDKTLAPEGYNTISVGFRLPYSYNDFWKTGNNRERGKEYYELKENISNSILMNISTVFPGLEKHIVVKDLATPMTYERYTGNSQGSMMGWEESTGGILRREPVANFQRVGHWSFPGGGTPRVLISGMIVSDMLIRKMKKSR